MKQQTIKQKKRKIDSLKINVQYNNAPKNSKDNESILVPVSIFCDCMHVWLEE